MHIRLRRRSQRPRPRRASHLLALVAAFWTSACGDGATSLAGPTADKCQISVTAFTRTFGASGGTGTVTLATARECSWSAATSTQWISFPSQAAGPGEGAFGFRVGANPAPRPREGAIEVSGHRLSVSQEGAPCRFEIDSGTTRTSASGGSGSVRVSAVAGCGWTARSVVSWLDVTGGESGDGSGTVSFTIEPNPGAARTGSLLVAGLTHRVEQAAAGAPPAPPPPSPPPPAPEPPPPPGCEYRLSPASATVPAAGGDMTLSLTTGSVCAWEASDDAEWVRVGPPVSGTGSAGIPVTVSPNTGESARQATVRVGSASVRITQEAAPPPCRASVSRASASFDAPGGEARVELTTGSDCGWTATSSAPWLSVAPESGTGDARLTLSASANTSSSARNATVTIAGERVIVTQDGAAAAEVQVEGRVQNLTGTCPNRRFRLRGNDAVDVVTSADTVYGPAPPGTACGDLRNGRTVVVTGVERAGVITATLIVFETNGPNP